MLHAPDKPEHPGPAFYCSPFSPVPVSPGCQESSDFSLMIEKAAGRECLCVYNVCTHTVCDCVCECAHNMCVFVCVQCVFVCVCVYSVRVQYVCACEFVYSVCVCVCVLCVYTVCVSSVCGHFMCVCVQYVYSVCVCVCVCVYSVCV